MKLILEGIEKHFGEKQVLKGASFSFAQGRIYPALNEALGAFEQENYEITCYNGYSVRFLSPTRFEAVLSPCIRYRGENDVFGRDGEYIDVHDYVCVLEVELT